MSETATLRTLPAIVSDLKVAYDASDWLALFNLIQELSLLAAPLPLRSETEEHVDTRVEGERRAAGPTGSAAASNEVVRGS